MSTAQITVLVIVIVVVLLLVGVAVVMNRRRSLRQRFGPEYDRAVESADDRRAAERELRERERRHAELELKPLDPAARERYSASWEEIQVRFVDAPEQAVGEADELVTRVIAERGYPTGDYDDQLSHLSVEHSRTLDHYRQAHDIHERNARGEATTEQLRQAFVHYRALFADLLGTEPDRLAGSSSTHDSDATPDRERQP
jgi:uncharacterized membrane protein